jgi:DNA-binding transcriptional regulator YdaS (Cro superfamily)
MAAPNGRFRRTHRDAGVDLAIEAAGGVSQLARLLGVRKQAIYAGWRKIPIHRIRQVSRITGIPREQLRPDIFEE